jgi:hypothetical protein
MYELEASPWILVFSTMLNNKPGRIITTREFAVFGSAFFFIVDSLKAREGSHNVAALEPMLTVWIGLKHEGGNFFT